jgi:cytochrome c553
MRNIVVGILTVIIFALMAWTASKGRAYHGGEQANVIENIGTKSADTTQQQIQQPVVANEQQKQTDKEAEELSALKEKAGNVGAIKVSNEYKSKCAACHGINGSGMQEGRKLMGPKLYGQSADKIYKDLIDFKDGRKENVIMKGLLINTTEEELKKYADEIGQFPSLTEASK